MGVPVFGWIAKKLFGTRNERMVKRYLKIVEKVNAFEPGVRALTDPELRGRTADFRARITGGENPLEMIPEILSVAREAMDRAVGIRSILNPEHGFDASLLPADAQKLFAEVKAAADAATPLAPEGDLAGCEQTVPGWMFIDIPPALYEAVRALYPESRPPFRARPFDVQIIGGVVLSEGQIAEMKTGEGKTIVGPLSCYLACCEMKQVHVVTVNDYLVQRDRDWTFPFFRALGLTVGAIHPQHMQGAMEKKAAYSCDVVYGTTAEFGFDYLRDNMKTRAEEQLQRKREFAVVDEVDSILIDEARTPLIISGPAHSSLPRYDIADRVARHLVTCQSEWGNAEEAVQRSKERIAGFEGDIRNTRDKSTIPSMKSAMDQERKELRQLEAKRDRFKQFYELELDKKQSQLTHDGIAEAQKAAGVGSFYVGDNIDLPHLVEQSLRAHVVYQRDRDYVVAPDEQGQMGVVIVDQNTGRKMVGRQWSDGLHQAVEAKEGVRIKEETQTMATITIQNFFKLYKRLAGMTGTADTEATEFHEIYHLDVVSIPTNVPIARSDWQDRVYLSQKDKWDAIVEDVKAFHDVGLPVLAGTTSVERSEHLARLLGAKHQIKHEVLNAKHHEREAEIVSGAGALGAVMIATNMAGRGTDIKLRPFTRLDLLEHWKRRNIAPKEAQAEMSDAEILALCWKHMAQRALTKEVVAPHDAAEVRMMLLRHWVAARSQLSEGKLNSLNEEALCVELDKQGRAPLHRLAVWTNIEAMGGLHIVGTERHESRRIDNQLRGRSGRQGDRGSSRFFLSLDDDLMKMFAGKTMLRALSTLGMKEGDDIEAPMLTRQIEKAQRKVEERNFQMRKNILEYDEPMEHQRRAFYGTRQPIVEDIGVRETIWAHLEESVYAAAEDYLGKSHVPKTIAEWVREQCGVTIDADRFIKKDREEIEKLVRTDAMEEAQHMIRVTAAEFMSPDLEVEDWDADGFASWAHGKFGAVITPEEIRTSDRSEIIRSIEIAASARYTSLDLSPLNAFLEPTFAATQLSHWAKRKFGVEVDSSRFPVNTLAPDAAELLVAEVKAAYERREVEFAIDHAIETANSRMEADAGASLTSFCAFVNARYELGWDAKSLPSNDPQELRRLLVARATALTHVDADARADAMLAQQTDPVQLEAWLSEQCLVRLTEPERERLKKDARSFLISKMRDLKRIELTQFERWVLLQIVDEAWKNHLLGMDQVRDAIGFRAFSQKDPRIEFKRESARLFEEMQDTVRDRVSDVVFRGRFQVAPRAAPRSAPAASEVEAAHDTAAMAESQAEVEARHEARAQHEVAQRTALAASVASSASAVAEPVDPATISVVGRNEPCPCGSGLKYRQCHGKKDA
ncbi:MAG: preprotein translocase subunit SecA [Phycisphaerales bacterium]|nr:preprotein translocase subunit SecA [Phycisphaerales bacterium]